MSKTTPQITLYGATWCPDCHRVKRFLGEHNLDYIWIDIDKSPAAAKTVSDLNGGQQTIPVIMLADHTVLSNPTNQELASALQIPVEPDNKYHDLIIVGAGPSGLSAAIYSTREDIKTVMLERTIVGGLAGITDVIDNYPGFPDGVSGMQLAADMEKQARRFGAEIKTGLEVTGIQDKGKYKLVSTSDGDYYAKSILIVTGSDYRKLGIPGEKQFTGRGVHYCATCDGPFYRQKHLVVVGGGNSAMQESLFLTKFASEITLLVRGPQLKGSEILIQKIKDMPQIAIHYNIATTEILGQGGKVSSVEGVNSSTGKTVEFKTDGVFVFVGLLPNTKWLKGVINLDEFGFVVTDKTFQTSMRGVYAAGDVRSGATLQIASAVGEGVTAALMIREYLKDEG